MTSARWDLNAPTPRSTDPQSRIGDECTKRDGRDLVILEVLPMHGTICPDSDGTKTQPTGCAGHPRGAEPESRPVRLITGYRYHSMDQ